MGRFINADAQFDSNAGFVGYNLFSYCANSPVSFKDSSGFTIETALDIASAIGSLIVLIANPTLENLGNLIWDVGSALIPFVPGSYVSRAGKLIVKVADDLSDFTNGSQLLAGTYAALRKLCKGLDNVEAHHLIEKRFSALFKGSTRKYLSILLTDDMHQIITNRWRNLHKFDEKFENFAYGSDYRKITYDLMVQAVNEVYKDMPDVLKATLEWVDKNWKGNR